MATVTTTIGSGSMVPTGTVKENRKATTCKECNITVNSEEQARSHYGGKAHQNRLKDLGIALPDNLPPLPTDALATKATACAVCKLSLNSEAQAAQHFSGRSHANRLKELAEGGVPVLQSPLAAAAAPTPAALTAAAPASTAAAPIAVAPTTAAPTAVAPATVAAVTLSGGNARNTSDTSVQPLAGVGDQSAETVAAASKRKAAQVTCSVCCLVLNSETQATLHFSSKRHIKRMKTQHETQKQWNSVLTGETPEMAPRKNRFYCQQCQLSVNSMTQLTAHMQGQQHCSKLQVGQHPYAISTIGQPGELRGLPGNMWTEVPGQKNGWFYCRQCDISVPTALALSQHIQSETHHDQKFLTYNGGDDRGSESNYSSTVTWNQSEEAPQFYDDRYADYVHYSPY